MKRKLFLSSKQSYFQFPFLYGTNTLSYDMEKKNIAWMISGEILNWYEDFVDQLWDALDFFLSKSKYLVACKCRRTDVVTGANFRIGICFQWAPLNTKDSTSKVCFLWKAKVSSEEKIKVFGKSTVAIHSLIMHLTEVDLSVYVGSDLAAICRTRCYNRLLRYKWALDRVGEIENEIKQDFKNGGPFRVKRLAKESGQKLEMQM